MLANQELLLTQTSQKYFFVYFQNTQNNLNPSKVDQGYDMFNLQA